MREKYYILNEDEFDTLMGFRNIANGLVLGYREKEQENNTRESFCFMVANYLDLLKQVVRVVSSKNLIIKQEDEK